MGFTPTYRARWDNIQPALTALHHPARRGTQSTVFIPRVFIVKGVLLILLSVYHSVRGLLFRLGSIAGRKHWLTRSYIGAVDYW